MMMSAVAVQGLFVVHRRRGRLVDARGRRVRRHRVHLCRVPRLHGRSSPRLVVRVQPFQVDDGPLRLYRDVASHFRLSITHTESLHIGVNPAGDAGDVSPPILWLVGTSMGMSHQYSGWQCSGI